MKLIVQTPVWEDLTEIAATIERDNPEAAERFLGAAEVAFEQIRRHPGIGRLRSFSVAGIRSWRLPQFENYLAFYLTTASEVKILAVLHGARDLAEPVQKRIS